MSSRCPRRCIVAGALNGRLHLTGRNSMELLVGQTLQSVFMLAFGGKLAFEVGIDSSIFL